MSIDNELVAWARVMAYLFVAVMVAEAATHMPHVRIALFWTAGAFILSGSGALMLAIRQPDLRDLLLTIQTVYLVLVSLVWIGTVVHISKHM